MEKRYQIFISSTYEDLVEERERVIRAVLLNDCFPACMEFFPAVGMPPISLIQRVLKECDYYILIIGDRYGSIYEDGMSFSEKEYNTAVDGGIPVIAFLRRGFDSLSIDESDEEGRNLARFRKKVEEGSQYVKKWGSPDELASLVSSSISWIEDLQPRRGWVRGEEVLSLQNLQVIANNDSYVIKIDDEVEFKMVFVEGGTFTMGATPEQKGHAQRNEYPAHSVTIKSFWIGETPVTQALWVKMMGYNPSYFSKSNGRPEDDLRLPVEQVSWNDCQIFIDKLNNAFKGKLGENLAFDFPTEEQWEYAARGGNKGKDSVYAGAGHNQLATVARYEHNSQGKTWPAGQSGLMPNELGLYDMSGNVWEWCKTVYSDYSSTGKRKKSVEKIVGRGGCWHSEENCCRVSFRASANITHAGNGLGLRLVLNMSKE